MSTNPFIYAIIDADPLIYRAGFAVEKKDKITGELTVEPLESAVYNILSMIKKIKEATNAKEYKFYLTSNDRSNFRFKIFPNYKANRNKSHKPVYYNELRDYLVKKFKAEIVNNEEADDRCSIEQCKNLKNDIESVVCSFDKDFNNIPGWHYDYVRDSLTYLNEVECYKHFCLQILTGDTADGIPRIKTRWLKRKVETELNNFLSPYNAKEETYEELMEQIILKEICFVKFEVEFAGLVPLCAIEDLPKYILKTFTERARLVWLRREENQLWTSKYESKHLDFLNKEVKYSVKTNRTD